MRTRTKGTTGAGFGAMRFATQFTRETLETAPTHNKKKTRKKKGNQLNAFV